MYYTLLHLVYTQDSRVFSKVLMGGVEWVQDDSKIWLSKGRRHVSTKFHSLTIWQVYGAKRVRIKLLAHLLSILWVIRASEKRYSKESRYFVIPRTE